MQKKKKKKRKKKEKEKLQKDRGESFLLFLHWEKRDLKTKQVS